MRKVWFKELAPAFVNSLVGNKSQPFMYMLPLAAFPLLEQSQESAAETIWQVMLKIFTIWPFTENVYRSQISTIKQIWPRE